MKPFSLEHPVLFTNIEGKSLSDEEQALLAHPAMAGVILFAENDQSIEDLTKLIAEIKAINSELIVAVDQEGGEVQRLTQSFVSIPSAYSLGEKMSEHPTETIAHLANIASVQARQLRDIGIDLNFTPVLDVHSERSTIIGAKQRAYHHDPKMIARLAEVVIDAHHQHGLLVCGKHFPGHGHAQGDTHTDIVHDKRSLAALCEQDLLPYRLLNNKLDFVMSAHVIYDECDPQQPATLSPFWLKDVLRKQLQSSAWVISDCLSMKGIAECGSFSDNFRNALAAGCDFVIMCHCRAGLKHVLSHCIEVKHKLSLSRISANKEIMNEHTTVI